MGNSGTVLQSWFKQLWYLAVRKVNSTFPLLALAEQAYFLPCRSFLVVRLGFIPPSPLIIRFFHAKNAQCSASRMSIMRQLYSYLVSTQSPLWLNHSWKSPRRDALYLTIFSYFNNLFSCSGSRDGLHPTSIIISQAAHSDCSCSRILQRIYPIVRCMIARALFHRPCILQTTEKGSDIE